MSTNKKKLIYASLSSGVLVALFSWLVLPDFSLFKLIIWGIFAIAVFTVEKYLFKKTPSK